jgi:hypothetical protein
MTRAMPLQLKDFPPQLRRLIKRESEIHRRSLTQEAIVLLEEALAARAAAALNPRDEIAKILDRYEKLPTRDGRPLAEMIEYDEFGLPR